MTAVAKLWEVIRDRLRRMEIGEATRLAAVIRGDLEKIFGPSRPPGT